MADWPCVEKVLFVLLPKENRKLKRNEINWLLSMYTNWIIWGWNWNWLYEFSFLIYSKWMMNGEPLSHRIRLVSLVLVEHGNAFIDMFPEQYNILQMNWWMETVENCIIINCFLHFFNLIKSFKYEHQEQHYTIVLDGMIWVD